MFILYVSDLHGSKWKYNKVLELAKKIPVDMVINGGDMYAKGKDLFKVQRTFLTDFLKGHLAKYQEAGIRYLCYPGNDDLKVFDGQFNDICASTGADNIARNKVTLGGYDFIGFDLVVDYPFGLKDRCRLDTHRDKIGEQIQSAKYSSEYGYEHIADWSKEAKRLPPIEEELQRLVKPADYSKAVYVVHQPPYALGMDMTNRGIAVGSSSVLSFMQNRQPLLSLHGHIHESVKKTNVWKTKIGRTTYVQPGQLDELTYVVIDLDRMSVSRYANFQ